MRHKFGLKNLFEVEFVLLVALLLSLCGTLLVSTQETSPTTAVVWYTGTDCQNFSSSANEGDYFLDTDDGNVFVFNGTAWQYVACISGASGSSGESGTDGTDGTSEFAHVVYSAYSSGRDRRGNNAFSTDSSSVVGLGCRYIGLAVTKSSTAPTEAEDFEWAFLYDEYADKTTYFAVTQNDDVCDYYAINSSGGTTLASGYGCTSYMDCAGADSITITMVATIDYGLAFYDEDKTFLSYVSAPDGSEVQVVCVNLDIPDGAAYFRTTFFDYENRQTYGDFAYHLYCDGVEVEQGTRDYQDGYIFFSRQVNQTTDNTDYSNVKVTTGVLALPKGYTADGEATKLIVYFHGYSHYVYYGTWGSTTNFRTQKQHFLDAGYAVLDCNGGRDNNRVYHFTSAGSQQYVDGYWQCVLYALAHYNIDAEVYVIGGSAGGPASINFTYWHSGNVKALMLLSTWTNLYTCSWGQNVRDTFVEYLGFENTSTYEVEKTVGYDPALRIKTDESGTEYIDDMIVPVRAFVGSEESAHVLYTALYRWIYALQQTYPDTQIIEWEGYDHTQIVSGADEKSDAAIIAFFALYP